MRRQQKFKEKGFHHCLVLGRSLCAFCCRKMRATDRLTDRFVHVQAAGEVIADGRALPSGIRNVSSTAVATRAPDVIAMHISDLWRADAGFERPGAANAVSDCHATGDGVTDDTHALQTCLDSHTEVFLPKVAAGALAAIPLHLRSSFCRVLNRDGEGTSAT